MKITLVRHTSVDVAQGVCYGQSDVPLRNSFKEEAQLVKVQLGTTKFDAVFTSPLSRCVKLADFCGHPDAIKDTRLMEINFGDWEMKSWDLIVDPTLDRWYDDWFHTAPTNGESSMQQQQRLNDFYNYLKSTGLSNVLIFTHGGIMIHTLLLTGAATLSNVFSLQPPYGGIMRIEL